MTHLRFAFRRLFKAPGFTFIAVFVLAALVGLARAASDESAPRPLDVLPFKWDETLILMEARIDQADPATFIVDTGASHSVLDAKYAKALGLKLTEAPPTTGTGAGPVQKSHGPPVALRLRKVNVEVPEPWIIDLSSAPIPREVKGLIGAELFKDFVVRLDPVRATLTVFAPDAAPTLDGVPSIPLLVEGDKLFLEATLEVPAGTFVKQKLRIDTGSGSSVNDEIVKKSAEVRTSTGGGGLGENFKSYSGVFTSIQIGPFEIKHVWGPGGPGPAVGMEILRRFVLTFDAPHGRLYLESTPALREPVPTPPAS